MVERTEVGSANRRRAGKKRIRKQKRHKRRNTVAQFHQGSDSRDSQGGTMNVRRQQTGYEMISDFVRMIQDRPSELSQDLRNRQPQDDTLQTDIERRRMREIERRKLERTRVSAGSS